MADYFPQTPDFPRWIPPAARNEILELRQREDVTPEQLAMLDRLATYETMQEVWQSLPPSAAGMEGQIIDWTFFGLGIAEAMRPPFPKKKAEFAEHLAKYPSRWTAQDATTLAFCLREAMDENRQSAEGIWEAYLQTTWPGQRLSYLEVRNSVERLTHFFPVLCEYNQAVAADLKLPTIRKKQAANAKELYLSRFLSQQFIDHFGCPYHSIVSALVAVALDSEAGPDAVTIRGRCRDQRKISSKN